MRGDEVFYSIPCRNLILSCVFLLCVSSANCKEHKNLPVVLWHGMGASCCERGHTNLIQKELEEKLGRPLTLSREIERLFMPSLI